MPDSTSPTCCRAGLRRTEEPGARGGRRLDTALALADPRAESPSETRLRLALVRAGLPCPRVQYPIMDEFHHPVARVDLAYPEARLAIEYDGETRFDRRNGTRDRRRDALLTGLGWATMRVTSDDMGPELPFTIRRIAELRATRVQ